MNGCNPTVQVIEKWGEGWHLKYVPLPNGEMIILELDGEASPFVNMESGGDGTAGNAAGWR
jgi:hypothetical protein